MYWSPNILLAFGITPGPYAPSPGHPLYPGTSFRSGGQASNCPAVLSCGSLHRPHRRTLHRCPLYSMFILGLYWSASARASRPHACIAHTGASRAGAPFTACSFSVGIAALPLNDSARYSHSPPDQRWCVPASAPGDKRVPTIATGSWRIASMPAPFHPKRRTCAPRPGACPRYM